MEIKIDKQTNIKYNGKSFEVQWDCTYHENYFQIE